jgi:hypothetical protein
LLIRKTADREIAAARWRADTAPTSGGDCRQSLAPQETSPDDGKRRCYFASIPTWLSTFWPGYAYLQTSCSRRCAIRQLDETYFKNTTLAAAVAAVAGMRPGQGEVSLLVSVLAEERDHYYPVDAFLIDLNMVVRQRHAQAHGAVGETPTALLSGDLLAEWPSRN